MMSSTVVGRQLTRHKLRNRGGGAGGARGQANNLPSASKTMRCEAGARSTKASAEDGAQHAEGNQVCQRAEHRVVQHIMLPD